MTKLKLGIHWEASRLPARRALQETVRLGVSGVQLDAIGELAPKNLSQTGRREFKNLLRSHNLELTAVGCPLRSGLDTTENQDARLDHVRAVLTLAYELGPRLVIIQAGRVPTDSQAPTWPILRDALLTLGQFGDRVGSVLALQTGLETGESLANFIHGLDTGGLGVDLDPANFLINRFDPEDNAKALHGLVRHVHAKDARSAAANRTAQEVPLGHGDLDWVQLLGILEEIDYQGWITVEREGSNAPVADMEAGVSFLRRLGV